MAHEKNYTELIAAAQAYARRDDIIESAWNMMLRTAEARIYRQLRTPNMETSISVLVTNNAPYLNIPTNLLEVKRFSIDNCPDLIRIDETTRIRHITNERYTQGQVPRFFSRANNQFNFWPIPSEDTTMVLVYYAEGAGISEDTPTSSMLNVAYDAYLFGLMVEVMAFTHYDERLPFWEKRFMSSLAEIQSMADNAEFAGSLKQEEVMDTDIGEF